MPSPGENETAKDGDVEIDLDLDKVNPVTDKSIVPKILRPFCEGKSVYWLRQKESK